MSYTAELCTNPLQYPAYLFCTKQRIGISTENLEIAELKCFDSHYEICLFKSPTSAKMLILRTDQAISRDGHLWLELITVYVNTFLYNLKNIEELLQEIKKLKCSKEYSTPWLDLLVWKSIEEEKNNIAQELHDTILQEQIHIVRQLNMLEEINDFSLEAVANIREQILDINYELRNYCEQLSPPLLDTLGLKPALQAYFKKVKTQVNFILKDDIAEVHVLNITVPLMIYRIIQELIHNAIKHSEASVVTIQLRKVNSGYCLVYEDNGIGFVLEEMTSFNTMGLRGIHERVKAIQGQIEINTSENQGTKVVITFE